MLSSTYLLTQRAYIQQEYKTTYSADLLKRYLLWTRCYHPHSKFGLHLETNTSGDHKKILLAYVTTPRHEGPEVNREMAEKDTKVLYKAGEKRLGTDEKTFVQIFSERSAAHLAAITSYYHSMYGHSLKKAVKKETSGNFALALLTIVQCAENPAKYFAKVFPLP
ncbi:Annexin D5 [Glycine soja]|uniref:Annexin n=1 Tax=Glycine soja TaxID=3848 RepID=A0A445KTE2_GLYSO|nr:Annexin D5 [Glycine soja]